MVIAALAKHATLPISSVSVQEDGSVTLYPSPHGPAGHYGGSKAEIHNLYSIAEAVGVEVSVTGREYSSGWYLTVAWQIGQIPVESQITVLRMAVDVRKPEPIEVADQPEPTDEQALELVAAHA